MSYIMDYMRQEINVRGELKDMNIRMSRMKRNSPLFELRVDHPVGEALTTDTDTLEYTVTLQLMQYEEGIDDTCTMREFLCETLCRLLPT